MGCGIQYYAGTAGNDTIVGTAFADEILAGAGDDTLTGAGGNDTIAGGDGTDTAVYSGNRSAYTIGISGGVTTVTGPDGTDTLTTVERLQFADGLYGIDGIPLPITGTEGANVLVGTGGADTINGLGGDDTITGGSGNDTIDGGAGTDTAVFSGTMVGSIRTTSGSVTTVVGPDGTDSLTNVERMQFSDGTLIVGAGGGQYYAGTANGDVISGTAFNDQIEAGGGDDQLNGAGGNDTIDGGGGFDTAVYTGNRSAYTLGTTAGVTSVSGADGLDALTNVERLQFADGYYTVTGEVIINTINGTDNGETLNGGLGVDVISGAGGNDIINGLGGDDRLSGGSGSDQINGGQGTDTLVLSGSASSYFFQAIEGGWRVYDGAQDVDIVTGVEQVQFGAAAPVSIGAAAASGFDAYRYMAGYPDLLTAFREAPQDAYRHFVSQGQSEGRSATQFDPLRYVASNPDLISVLGTNERIAAEHYVTSGSLVGRSATSFDPARYLASHSDLLTAFGNDPAKALDHYLIAGFVEGRATTSFDPARYLASHSDLLAAFGNDTAKALDHYLVTGFVEGRASSGFDSVAYLLSNSDFAGLSSEQALEHWLVAGFGEGRSGDTLFGREQGSDHLLLTSRTSQLDGDRDWFQFSANAGEQFTLDLGGAGAGLGTLQDGILQIYDARGHLLATDDNSGPANDARVSFTVPASGTYYVVVLSPGSGAGTYQISLSSAGSLPPEEVKTVSSPVVLPALDSGVGSEGEKLAPDLAPEVLPTASEDFALIGSEDSMEPEVLPEESDELAKESGPQTLPGETDVLPTVVRDQVNAADFAPRDGDIAATLSLFGDLPVDDGYLVVAGTDADSPEVLPAMHDDFVLTAKFAESPPVMPPLAGDFDGVGKGGNDPLVLPGVADVSGVGKGSDVPVVLPAASDDLVVDARALPDRSVNRDGDPSLTVMVDGGIIGDPDGSFDFGLGDADADVFDVTGDTPLVLPGETVVDRFDIGALSDLFTGRDGDLPPMVMEDGTIIGSSDSFRNTLNFDVQSPDGDGFLLTGDLVDQRLVMPGETTGDSFGLDPMSDLFAARAGQSQVTVTEEGQVSADEPLFDTTGLYNWA